MNAADAPLLASPPEPPPAPIVVRRADDPDHELVPYAEAIALDSFARMRQAFAESEIEIPRR
jgi:hypothetical protein